MPFEEEFAKAAQNSKCPLGVLLKDCPNLINRPEDGDVDPLNDRGFCKNGCRRRAFGLSITAILDAGAVASVYRHGGHRIGRIH
jgi:hypothetical protein